MINEDALKEYLRQEFGGDSRIQIKKLGSGVHGAGFLIEIETDEGLKSFVIKGLVPKDFSHDYPSDRAGVFLLDLDEFKNLPKHVKAIDVLAEVEDGKIKSVGGGREYYLLMEKAEGRDYFKDLDGFRDKERLDSADIEKIISMTSYLSEIHAIKKDSRTLYWRKLRDNIGHGECIMGVLDTYPDGVLSYDEMAEIEKKTVDWRARLKPSFKRLSEIHGDFHPGNILFKEVNRNRSEDGISNRGNPESPNSELRTGFDFILLDRSRGPWGEPADDITALTINYIFFSVRFHGRMKGAYDEGLKLFFEDYVRRSGDSDIYSVVQPFFAFRGVVVANPLFYPELTLPQRKRIFRFVNNVLNEEVFDPEKINDYLG